MDSRNSWLAFASLALLAMLVLTGIRPFHHGTWLMEVLPVIIVLPLLWATHRRFPLTTVLYVCIFLHAIVLMVGGAYTYARVPIGFEVQEWLGLDRNPYDKLGHFMQGFAPALAAREILLRGVFVRIGISNPPRRQVHFTERAFW